jgi:hypothetical protein
MLKNFLYFFVIGIAVVSSLSLVRIYMEANSNNKDFQLSIDNTEDIQKVDEHPSQVDLTKPKLVNIPQKSRPFPPTGKSLGEVFEAIDLTESHESILLGFLMDAADGEYSDEQFLKLQSLIKEDNDALAVAMDLIFSSEFSYSEKNLIVELISARSDETTINFAMELIQNSAADFQSLGAELATNIMWNGKTADMLEPIAMNIYTDQNRDVAKMVFYGIGNISMEEQDKDRVTQMLSDYVQNGEDELKPVALQSLGALVADDEYKVAALFNQYHTSDYSDDVRYSALETLYNLEVERLSSDIEYKLTDIANDPEESYYLRSIAMRLLGNFVESYEKDRNTAQN